MKRVGSRSAPGRRATISDSWMAVFSEKIYSLRIVAGHDGFDLEAFCEKLFFLEYARRASQRCCWNDGRKRSLHPAFFTSASASGAKNDSNTGLVDGAERGEVAFPEKLGNLNFAFL